MSNYFIFQVETSVPLDQATIQIEGRCCEGYIQKGDCFTELLARTSNTESAFSTANTSAVSIRVHKVTSIRPQLLGLGETGTLIVSGAATTDLKRDCLLMGRRS